VGEPRKVSVAQVLVYELRVRDAMSKPPVTAAPSDSLRTIQNLMKQHKFSGVPITPNGKLVGLISIEDIINALDHGYINDPAEKHMTTNLVTLRDHYSLLRAVAEFDRHGFGRFPVLDTGDRLVGMITRGDITTCLMHHLEKRAEEALAHEALLMASQAADRAADRQVIRAAVKTGDYDSAGKISQRMRQILRDRAIDPEVRRRAAVVAYEAETNIIIHSLGGEIIVTIDPDRVVIEANDVGPGIESIEQAMQEGWSTAGRLPRELGFGAGMGLPNIKRCSDHLDIQSTDHGTRLRSEVNYRLQPILPDLQAQVLTDSVPAEVAGCYISDLLSDVLAHAEPDVLWLTVQVHRNIVSVAAMKDVAAILITCGRKPDPAIIAEADQEGIAIIATPLSTYQAAGKLWEAGFR
jgi:CBS domain-containing protein/anti-sigma regulatory factor (Ser/Thr protein kinase)